MKKVLLILFVLFSINSFSQTYHPFPDSVGVWRQVSTTGDPDFNPPFNRDSYSLFLNGDTILNNNTYQKLYKSESPYNIDTSSAVYIGALREINKKIYFYPDSLGLNNSVLWYCHLHDSPSPLFYNSEALLYDFDVIIGDTVHFHHMDTTFLVINSIDSILIANQYRKKYNYFYSSTSNCNGQGYDNSYVEGIGNINSGLLSLWIFYFENSEQLSCFEDNEIFYSNVPNCETVGIKKEKVASNLKIYPNPTSEKLFIEFSNKAKRVNYSIFDIAGKKVISSILSKSNSIDVSSLKKGLYLLKLKTESGQLKSTLINIQ